MDNIIPKITNPLGFHWNQPDAENFIINDEYAIMTQKDFDKLKKYDSSYPSGVYEGKMWSRTNGNISRLVWYSAHPTDKDKCNINFRIIAIID